MTPERQRAEYDFQYAKRRGLRHAYWVIGFALLMSSTLIGWALRGGFEIPAPSPEGWRFYIWPGLAAATALWALGMAWNLSRMGYFLIRAVVILRRYP